MCSEYKVPHLNLSKGIKQEKTRKKGVRRKKKQTYRKQRGFGELTNVVLWVPKQIICITLSGLANMM